MRDGKEGGVPGAAAGSEGPFAERGRKACVIEPWDPESMVGASLAGGAGIAAPQAAQNRAFKGVSAWQAGQRTCGEGTQRGSGDIR